MAKAKAKTKSKAKTKTKAKAMTKPKTKAKIAAKPKAKIAAKPKAKTTAKRVTAKSAATPTRPTKSDIGKRRAKTTAADEVRLRVTAPVRLVPARRPAALLRELPLFDGKE